MGRRGVGFGQDESRLWLDPMLSLDLRLPSLKLAGAGGREPSSRLRPSRGAHLRHPPSRTSKLFPPAGRGRVLLSLKGKSRPLPGFRLAGVGPTSSRAAAGLAERGEPRRRPASGGQPGAPRWQVGPGPPAPPPLPPRALAALTLEGLRAARSRCAAGSRAAKNWP